jgi:hypothetical protein
MGILDTAAMLLSLIGLWLNGRRSLWCWPVWLASNFAWIAHWLIMGYAGETMQWMAIGVNVAFCWMNVSGWRQWRKAEQ